MADKKNSNKVYSPKEVAAEVTKTLRKKLTEYEGAQIPKNYTPREVVSKIANALKEKVKGYEEIEKNSFARSNKAEDNAGNPTSNPAKPMMLNQKPLSGCELTHLDAVEHHAFHASARFHEDKDKLAQDHLLLAKAHATVAAIDPKPMIEFAYDLTSEIEPISETFGDKLISHPMDEELSKKIKKMGLGPMIGANSFAKQSSSEEVDIASGKGVDKEHVGYTPDDRLIPKDNSHAEDAEVSKEEPTAVKERAKKAKKDFEEKQGNPGVEKEEDEDEDEKKKKKDKKDKKEDLEKDYLSSEIRDIKDQKGYKKNPVPKRAMKTEEKEYDLDGKGSSGGCNSTMNKGKGK